MDKNKIDKIIERASVRLKDFERFQELGMIPQSGEFFPGGVHYPPITMYPPTTEEQIMETYTLPPDGKFDVYVHIPFCRTHCTYCHYPSLYGAPDAQKDLYLDHLEKEMDIVMQRLGVDRIQVHSILIGGGTPTDLTPKQLKRFLDFFCARLDMSQVEQFNYDVDPSTLVGTDGIERLKIMRDYGVDRQTIGIQSFNDKILKKMNRSHDSTVALESIENCLNLGYQVNIEFIFGYPGQTLENWIEVVDRAIKTDVHEIQFYRLKIDPYGDQTGTITSVRKRKPEIIPDAKEAILMKQISIDMLADAGYHENLRRVFTKKKKYISRYAYNQCCNLYDEIGFGLSAFSSLRDRFIINTQFFDEYYKAVESGKMPMNRGLERSKEEQMRWATILPLKNFSIRKRIWEERTGLSFDKCFPNKFKALEDLGLVTISDKKIELTRMGAFFADEVVMQFESNNYLALPESDYADGPLNPWTKSAVIEPGLLSEA